MTYRSFTRLIHDSMLSRSGLQSTIRGIKLKTLEAIDELPFLDWLEPGVLSMNYASIARSLPATSYRPAIANY
jgi:hypothetical protein